MENARPPIFSRAHYPCDGSSIHHYSVADQEQLFDLGPDFGYSWCFDLPLEICFYPNSINWLHFIDEPIAKQYQCLLHLHLMFIQDTVAKQHEQWLREQVEKAKGPPNKRRRTMGSSSTTVSDDSSVGMDDESEAGGGGDRDFSNVISTMDLGEAEEKSSDDEEDARDSLTPPMKVVIERLVSTDGSDCGWRFWVFMQSTRNFNNWVQSILARNIVQTAKQGQTGQHTENVRSEVVRRLENWLDVALLYDTVTGNRHRFLDSVDMNRAQITSIFKSNPLLISNVLNPKDIIENSSRLGVCPEQSSVGFGRYEFTSAGFVRQFRFPCPERAWEYKLDQLGMKRFLSSLWPTVATIESRVGTRDVQAFLNAHQCSENDIPTELTQMKRQVAVMTSMTYDGLAADTQKAIASTPQMTAQAWKQLRAKQLDKFISIQNPQTDISPNMHLVNKWAREYLLEHPNLCIPFEHITSNLTPFAEYVQYHMNAYEAVFNASTCHDMLFRAMISHYDCYAPRSFHFNVLNAGPFATSKSFVIDCIGNWGIPETTCSLTYQTLRADTASGDFSCSHRLYEEAPPAMLNNAVNNEQVAMMKQMITAGGRVRLKSMSIVDGVRIATDVQSNHNGSIGMATNDPIHLMDPAMVNRFFVHNATKLSRAANNTCFSQRSMMEMASVSSSPGRQKMEEAYKTRYRRDQYLVSQLFHMIRCKLIKPVNTKLCNPLLTKILKKAKRYGCVDTEEVRHKKRVEFVIEILVFLRAITIAFDSPARFWDLDTHQFHLSDLFLLEPYLVADEEVIIFALTLLRGQYERSEMHDVLKVLYSVVEDNPDYQQVAGDPFIRFPLSDVVTVNVDSQTGAVKEKTSTTIHKLARFVQTKMQVQNLEENFIVNCLYTMMRTPVDGGRRQLLNINEQYVELHMKSLENDNIKHGLRGAIKEVISYTEVDESVLYLTGVMDPNHPMVLDTITLERTTRDLYFSHPDYAEPALIESVFTMLGSSSSLSREEIGQVFPDLPFSRLRVPIWKELERLRKIEIYFEEQEDRPFTLNPVAQRDRCKELSTNQRLGVYPDMFQMRNPSQFAAQFINNA